MIVKQTVKRPWGFFDDIYRSEAMVIKKIVIYPGARFSLQYHNKRSEYWGIECGYGELILGGSKSVVVPSNMIYIPSGIIHRLHNIGDESLVLFETQIGVCEEDDIVRLSDDYGR